MRKLRKLVAHLLPCVHKIFYTQTIAYFFCNLRDPQMLLNTQPLRNSPAGKVKIV